MSTGILGIGSYVPDVIVTNADLEKRLDTSDEWIRTRTGIQERRFARDDMETSHMATEAAKEALNHANLQPEEIDLIIVATVTPDYVFPSVACLVQKNLGAKKAAAMDVSAACAGSMYGIITGQQFIESGAYKHVLVIGADKLSKLINWEDRNTAVLFGDGASAVVLGNVPEGKGILAFELGADGTGSSHLYGNPMITMNGREVFKFAVRQMGESCLRVVEKAGLQKEDVDFLVPHQANIRIMEAARERLGLSKEKVSVVIDKYGNTSSASVIMALCEEYRNGKIHDGQNIVLVGFGGGLTWGAVMLRWGK